MTGGRRCGEIPRRLENVLAAGTRLGGGRAVGCCCTKCQNGGGQVCVCSHLCLCVGVRGCMWVCVGVRVGAVCLCACMRVSCFLRCICCECMQKPAHDQYLPWTMLRTSQQRYRIIQSASAHHLVSPHYHHSDYKYYM